MKIEVLKLGTKCTDKATQTKGTLLNWMIRMDGRIDYIFQPKALNPDTGHPVDRVILEKERLRVKGNQLEQVDIPFEILGTQVTDVPTGFTGMAVGFVRHINGCFHVVIQPAGILKDSKNIIDKTDFDLRSCTGKMIKKLGKKALAKSKIEDPSPERMPRQKRLGNGSLLRNCK